MTRPSTSEADGNLERLLASVLFERGFPRRLGLTAAEQAALRDSERTSLPDRVARSHDRIDDLDSLETLIGALGQARHEAAVPALARLWKRSAVPRLRAATAQALFSIGTPDALGALVSLLDDAEEETVVVAARALLMLDPARAFARLAPAFEPSSLRAPGGAVLPRAVALVFCPDLLQAPDDWTGSLPRQWMRAEPRWAELFFSARFFPGVDRAARLALRWADPAVVGPRLDGALARERARSDRKPRPAGDLLSRYQAGEHAAVWKAMRSLAWLDDERYAECLAVCKAAMERAGSNARLLVERLGREGWQTTDDALLTPLTDDDRAVMARVEAKMLRPLPPLLRAFWEELGEVSLVFDVTSGDSPDLGIGVDLAHQDPFAFCAPTWEEATSNWEDGQLAFPPWFDDQRVRSRPWPREISGPYWMMFAGDAIMKAGASGANYDIDLASPRVDPPCAWIPVGSTLLDHLRDNLRWAGFPGLNGDRSPLVRAFVTWMTRGFEPF